MLEPDTISDAIVSAWRSIPSLVALMAGDATKIYAYQDEYPTSVDVFESIRQMSPPSIMVVFQESGPGQLNRLEVWKHRFSAFVRPLGKISPVWAAMMNGLPLAVAVKMRWSEVHPSLMRMDPPSLRRQFLQVSEFSTIDYFEASITYTEKGD